MVDRVWLIEQLIGGDAPLVVLDRLVDVAPKIAIAQRGVRVRVHVFGHPTARLIGKRQPIEFDFDEVFAAAARTGTALEVNGFPDRLDLRDEHILWAKRHGARFSVDTDSHAAGHLANMRFGVATAQRGWLTKDDVVNAWPLSKLKRFLQKPRATSGR